MSLDPSGPESTSTSARVRWTRFSGFVLIVTGALVLAYYLLSRLWEPLQQLPRWFRQLDGPIQFGLGAATLGALILGCSVVWERWQDWRSEKRLPDGRY